MLTKQSLNINFSQGLDLKTDPFQVQLGKFLSLENAVFDKGGRLTKRNGYEMLGALPDTSSKFATTFNGNLTAIGDKILAYTEATGQWVNKGNLQPIDVNTLPLVRSNTNQPQADSAIAPNGLMCTAYTDDIPSGVVYKYVIADSVTGQNIVPPTLLVDADPTFGTPRVFLMQSFFIVVYTTSSNHLQYIAISTTNPQSVTAPADIATSYVPSSTLSFDGLVVSGRLFIAYDTLAGGQSVKVTYIAPNLTVVTPVTFAGEIATMFSLTADETNSSNPIIYVSYFDSGSDVQKVLAVDINLGIILAPTTVLNGMVLNIASTAQNGVLTTYSELSNFYGYDGSIQTDYIYKSTVTQAGVVTNFGSLIRSVGLASKAFLFNGQSYFLAVYNSPYQPSYFLINGLGQVVAKLAYSNAGPYYTHGLPNYSDNNDVFQIPYLFKDQIEAVNKTQGVANTAGVYAQLGVNLVSFNFDFNQITTSEIGSNLDISGGYISAYDGVSAVEQEFFVWPDYVEAAANATSGSMTPQQYFYQVTYEWADNQGNLFRSAPSIPVGVTLSSDTSVLINIPTLRLTYKIASPVKIVIYRWSQAQQNYYQVTSITSPLLNDPTVDYLSYTDTQSDSEILGNNLIYTTGGVIENISPPASALLTLFNNRQWLVDSEDRNLLWFSKQVIESTPVEFSDLLTEYVAPSTASEGSTGPITAIAPMDDKLIVFKANALGYINGTGPDNTGANNQYSDFILINSVVGCTNQNSIVFMPQGLMFQSNKGIWLLGRDLSTTYIGAPVESLTTGALVESALNIPTTNQVRFTMNNGITLMYDYYYQQWGSFTNVPAISSTIYQSLHTFINSFGQVFQETPGEYLDNTSPVLMSFTTGWINLAGLQGFERFYQMYLLGEWITPFKLQMLIGYDYNPSGVQSTMVTPAQSPSTWGSDNLWGSGTSWGDTPSSGFNDQANVFEARIFPQRQKCESFQITMNEIFDSSFGVAAGAGLTLSGMNLIVGVKRGFRTSRASRNFG